MNVPACARPFRKIHGVLFASALLLGAGCSGSAGNGAPASGGASAGSGGAASGGRTGSGGGGVVSSGSGGSGSGGRASGVSGSGGSGSGGSGQGGTRNGGSSLPSSSGGGGGGGGGAVPGGGGAAGSGSTACPTDAFFCSGFEDATLPTALVYRANAAPGDWSRDYELDTTVHNSGKASLRVKASTEAGTSGSAYKMLAAPAATAFWARFYIQSDMDIGGLNHNAFAAASGSDDPNDGVSVEFAEDVGIAFNSKDDDRWPAGYGRTMSGGTNPFTLPKGTWHCIELSYDGVGKAQKLYIDSTLEIDTTNYPTTAATFQVFKFGFMEFHGPPRKVWFDDVVVSPNRTPCH
jgi:hypothetical protein